LGRARAAGQLGHSAGMRLFVLLCLLSAVVCNVAMGREEAASADPCGVERAMNEMFSNARLEACAASGDATAQANLGFLYWSASLATYCRADVCQLDDPAKFGLNASLTLTQLQNEGFRLMTAAAAAGNAEAQNELGLAYLNGDFGVAADFEAARRWLIAATDNGDPIAPYNLARIHFGGLGVERSTALGEEFLRLSATREYLAARCSLALWLAQYSDANRRREVATLRGAIASADGHCSANLILDEMRLVETGSTL